MEKGKERGKEEGGGKEKEGGGEGREGKGVREREKGKEERGEEGKKNVEQRGASQVLYKDKLTSLYTSVLLQSHSVLEVVLTRGLCCPCQQRPHHHCGCSQC